MRWHGSADSDSFQTLMGHDNGSTGALHVAFLRTSRGLRVLFVCDCTDSPGCQDSRQCSHAVDLFPTQVGQTVRQALSAVAWLSQQPSADNGTRLERAWVWMDRPIAFARRTLADLTPSSQGDLPYAECDSAEVVVSRMAVSSALARTKVSSASPRRMRLDSPDASLV